MMSAETPTSPASNAFLHRTQQHPHHAQQHLRPQQMQIPSNMMSLVSSPLMPFARASPTPNTHPADLLRLWHRDLASLAPPPLSNNTMPAPQPWPPIGINIPPEFMRDIDSAHGDGMLYNPQQHGHHMPLPSGGDGMLYNPLQHGHHMPPPSGGRGSPLGASCRDATTQCETKRAAQRGRPRSEDARGAQEDYDGAEVSSVPGFPGMGAWELEAKKRMKAHAHYSRCTSATGSRRQRRKPSKWYVDDGVSPAGFRGMGVANGTVRRQKQEEYSKALDKQIREKTSRSPPKRSHSPKAVAYGLWGSLGMCETTAHNRAHKWKCELDTQLIELQQNKAKRKEEDRVHDELLEAKIQRQIESDRLRINHEKEVKALREQHRNFMISQTMTKHIEAIAESARSAASRGASRSHSPLGSRVASRRVGRTRSRESGDRRTRSDLASIDDGPDGSDLAFGPRATRQSAVYSPFSEHPDEEHRNVPARTSSSVASAGRTTTTPSSSPHLPGRPCGDDDTSTHRASHVDMDPSIQSARSAMTPGARASLLTLDEATRASALDYPSSLRESILQLDPLTRASVIALPPPLRDSLSALDETTRVSVLALPVDAMEAMLGVAPAACATLVAMDPASRASLLQNAPNIRASIATMGYEDRATLETISPRMRGKFLAEHPATRGAFAALGPQAQSAVAAIDPNVLSSLAYMDPPTRSSVIAMQPVVASSRLTRASIAAMDPDARALLCAMEPNAAVEDMDAATRHSFAAMDPAVRASLLQNAPNIRASIATMGYEDRATLETISPRMRWKFLAEHPATRGAVAALSLQAQSAVAAIDPAILASLSCLDPTTRASLLEVHPDTASTVASQATTQQRGGMPWARARASLDSTTRAALERVAPVLAAHARASGGGPRDADARAAFLAAHPTTRDVFLALSPHNRATLCAVDPTTVLGSLCENDDRRTSSNSDSELVVAACQSGLVGVPPRAAAPPALYAESAAPTPSSSASSSCSGGFRADAHSPLRRAGRARMVDDAAARMAYNEREADMFSESRTYFHTQIATNEARAAELDYLLDVRHCKRESHDDFHTIARTLLRKDVEKKNIGAHHGGNDPQEGGSKEDAELWRQDLLKGVENNFLRVVNNLW
eukprot:GEMP01004168.1.p1 GENE.GEMP01004168.1~~GEMP01004168.1.p1  ORF type:complete len:1131 (+),score=361.69 GEMP01004168.1:222-3614(+)